MEKYPNNVTEFFKEQEKIIELRSIKLTIEIYKLIPKSLEKEVNLINMMDKMSELLRDESKKVNKLEKSLEDIKIHILDLIDYSERADIEKNCYFDFFRPED